MCPETAANSDPVGSTELDGPSAAAGDSGRRSHQNKPRRGRRGGIRKGHRTPGQSSPRRSAVSLRRWARLRQVVRHLMCSSSATSTSLLEHRALRTLATNRLPTIFLTFVASRKLPISDGAQVDVALTTNSNAQYMFRGAAPSWQHTDGCRHAQISPILQTRGWQATKIPSVSARMVLLALGHTRKYVPLNVWFPNRRTRLGESAAHGRSLLPCRPSELLPMRTRQLVPPTSSVTQSWSLLVPPRVDGQCTKTSLTDASILLDRKWCRWVEKVVAILHLVEALVFPFFPTTSSGQNSQKHGSLPVSKTSLSTKLHIQAPASIEQRTRELTDCQSRRQWRTDQSGTRRALVWQSAERET